MLALAAEGLVDPDVEAILDHMEGVLYWKCPSCGVVFEATENNKDPEQEIVFVVEDGKITSELCLDCHEAQESA